VECVFTPRNRTAANPSSPVAGMGALTIITRWSGGEIFRSIPLVLTLSGFFTVLFHKIFINQYIMFF
jgi:hypothetical protein